MLFVPASLLVLTTASIFTLSLRRALAVMFESLTMSNAMGVTKCGIEQDGARVNVMSGARDGTVQAI